MLADGGGLYLQIVAESDGTINRSWIFRFATGKTKTSKNGKVHNIERQMGLGSLDTISLAEAREKALKCRKLRHQGIDPIEARRADRANAALEAARVMTFDQCRDAFVAAKQAGWRNVKHASQWRNTLTTYVTPVFGNDSSGEESRYGASDEGPAAVVDQEARDREARPRSDRGHSRLGQGMWLS